MNHQKDPLAEALNTEPIDSQLLLDDFLSKSSSSNVIDVDVNTSVTVLQQDTKQEIVTKENDDFDTARENFKELLKYASSNVVTAAMVASQSDSPKAIEALTGALKAAAEINKNLLSLNQDRINIEIAKSKISSNQPSPQTPPNGQTTINQQNIIVGTLDDLDNFLKSRTNLISENND